jgi:hypothetical protein
MGHPGDSRGPVLAPAPVRRIRLGVDGLFAVPVGRGFTARGAALAVLATALGTVLLLWRQPGAGALDTIWAEDGSVFLSQATQHGFWASLVTSYAGYYHLLPRLLAGVAAAAPASAAATVLAVEAAVCTAMIAVLVYLASAGHLASRLPRLVVAAYPVLLPLGMGDLPNSIANLHWPGLFALFWVLIWTPRGRTGRLVAVATVLLVTGSDILTVVFAPLALLRLLTRPRERHAVVLTGALLAGVGVQVLGRLIGASSRTLTPDAVAVLRGYGLRGVPPALLGERFLGSDVDARWLVLAGLAWLLVAAALLAGLTRFTRARWPLAVTALVFSVGAYALPVLLSGSATIRYAAAPAMLLVTSLMAVLQPNSNWIRARAPQLGLVALLAVVCAVNLRVHNARADGPSWAAELEKARVACAGAPGRQTVSVPIPPSVADQPAGSQTPWAADLPCRYLRRG